MCLCSCWVSVSPQKHVHFGIVLLEVIFIFHSIVVRCVLWPQSRLPSLALQNGFCSDRHIFDVTHTKRLRQPLRYICHTGIIDTIGHYIYTYDGAGCFSVALWDILKISEENELYMYMYSHRKMRHRLEKETHPANHSRINSMCRLRHCYLRKQLEQQLTRDVLSRLRVEHVKCVRCLCAHSMYMNSICAHTNTHTHTNDVQIRLT